jgi:hypothetical protein
MLSVRGALAAFAALAATLAVVLFAPGAEPYLLAVAVIGSLGAVVLAAWAVWASMSLARANRRRDPVPGWRAPSQAAPVPAPRAPLGLPPAQPGDLAPARPGDLAPARPAWPQRDPGMPQG